MKSSAPSSRPRFITLLALLCGGLVTVATSPTRGSNGSSAVPVQWSGERQLLQVQIAPLEDRIASFDYDGSLRLELKIHRIDQERVGSVRWSLDMPLADGEPFSRSGGFTTTEGREVADNGKTYGEVRLVLGRLCTDGELAADGCLPCRVSTGCTFSLALDRCHPHPNADEEGANNAELVILRDNDETFQNHCPEDSDSQPCDKLDDWITLETRPLEPSLCDP
jgi:hypothetical protein